MMERKGAIAPLYAAFESVLCRIEAPAPSAAVLRTVLARHLSASGVADVTVFVEASVDGWYVSSDAQPAGPVCAVGSIGDLAAAVIRCLEPVLASRLGVRVEPGFAISRDGESVVFRGAAAEDVFGFVAHLATRNWKLVSTAATFIDGDHRVGGIQQLLSARLSVIPRVPDRCRGAIEMSPWFVENGDIRFYAIEPVVSLGSGMWAKSALHGATLRVVRQKSTRPAILTDRHADANCMEAIFAADMSVDPLACADFFEAWWNATGSFSRAASL